MTFLVFKMTFFASSMDLRRCVKVEVAVIGSPFLMSIQSEHAVRTGLRSFVKVEVTVLSFPSLIVRRVSLDVKQHRTKAV